MILDAFFSMGGFQGQGQDTFCTKKWWYADSDRIGTLSTIPLDSIFFHILRTDMSSLP